MDGMISTTLPIFEGGYVVGELNITVRPRYDEAFSDPYAASDVFFEDSQENRHAFPDKRAREVLAQIRRDQPLVWSEIEAEA